LALPPWTVTTSWCVAVAVSEQDLRTRRRPLSPWNGPHRWYGQRLRDAGGPAMGSSGSTPSKLGSETSSVLATSPRS